MTSPSYRSRLLAINFGGIGDEILFLPALESIRAAHPEWHITLLLEPRSQSVAQVTDLIDSTISFDIKKQPLFLADLLDLLGLLRDGAYDFVLSSGSSPLVSMLLFLSGIPVRVGYHASFLSGHLLTAAVPLNKNQYAAAMYHDLVSGLGVTMRPGRPTCSLKAESVAQMQKLLQSAGAGTTDGANSGRAAKAGIGTTTRSVLIHPGTSRLALEKGIIKTWPVGHWVWLVEQLTALDQVRVILAGGPDDREIVKEIEAAAGPALISAGAWTRNLSDLAALIHLADLIVCVDSAPMHLAVGLGKHLVALFGPTDAAKLLPEDERFLALRGGGAQDPKLPSVADSPPSAASPRQPAGAPTRPGVEIPPDIVFQAVMDQLSRASGQGSSPESRR